MEVAFAGSVVPQFRAWDHSGVAPTGSSNVYKDNSVSAPETTFSGIFQKLREHHKELQRQERGPLRLIRFLSNELLGDEDSEQTSGGETSPGAQGTPFRSPLSLASGGGWGWGGSLASSSPASFVPWGPVTPCAAPVLVHDRDHHCVCDACYAFDCVCDEHLALSFRGSPGALDGADEALLYGSGDGALPGPVTAPVTRLATLPHHSLQESPHVQELFGTATARQPRAHTQNTQTRAQSVLECAPLGSTEQAREAAGLAEQMTRGKQDGAPECKKVKGGSLIGRRLGMGLRKLGRRVGSLAYHGMVGLGNQFVFLSPLAGMKAHQLRTGYPSSLWK